VAEWLRSGLQSRLHRFDSGRRLSVLRVPLMRLAVLMAVGGVALAPGCGGGDADKGDDEQVVRAQDAQAKADARSLVSTVGHSKSGTAFTVAKKADGGVARSCDAPGKGSCSGDGTW
jgi:hypothetical protein